ncbi:hypothetical protein EDL96_08015 [Kocuria soli]|uniref:Tat pathway signal sequence domain protein n=1 Tax=Kocuria soli TaxID=2485125 RepID=A0A3N3ZPT6_9MICC|nr:hypothetical protein [Kocuria soli]ROZ63044.1 hypothetical protein EDL96_08015 [Kocuria soli]
MPQEPPSSAPGVPTHQITRRRIVTTAAWTAPAVLAATAAPAYAASQNQITTSVCQLFYRGGRISYQTHSIYLGVTSTEGVVPRGTVLTWTVQVSGGGTGTGGTNESPTTNYSQNNAWTLSVSPSTGTVPSNQGSVVDSSLSYTVARRHPSSVNSTGRTPHVYRTRSGGQSAYPTIRWSRLITNNGYDNVTRYPDNTENRNPASDGGNWVTPARA